MLESDAYLCNIFMKTFVASYSNTVVARCDWKILITILKMKTNDKWKEIYAFIHLKMLKWDPFIHLVF